MVALSAAIADACTRHAAPADVTGEALHAHVAGVREVLRLRAAGAFPQAQAHLKTLATANAPTLQALALDLVYDTGRCDDFTAGYEAASPEAHAVVTDGAARLAECQAAPEPSVDPPSAPTVADVATLSAESDGGGSSSLGWITLSSGAALAGASVACLALWADASGRHAEAQDLYLRGTPDEALLALPDMETAAADGALFSGLGVGLGVAGAAALGVGLLMVLSGDDAPDDGEAPSTALYPVVGPGHVGLGGSF